MTIKRRQTIKQLPKWRASTLSKMTAPELLRLKRALEGSEGMLVDSGIYKAVVDTIWDRIAVPVTAWPTLRYEPDRRINLKADDEVAATGAAGVTSPGLRIVQFCTAASDGWTKEHDVWTREKALGPDDPAHQPVRRARPRGRVASSQTLGDIAGDWGFEWYECSCGIRDGDARVVGRATGRSWRVKGEPGGWPRSDSCPDLNLRDVKKGMYLVCKRALSLDDRQHAHSTAYPGSKTGTMRATFICICGSSAYDDEIQQIPVEGEAP